MNKSDRNDSAQRQKNNFHGKAEEMFFERKLNLSRVNPRCKQMLNNLYGLYNQYLIFF